MGKCTIYSSGYAKVKIDTADSVYSDKKEPHVSIEYKGTEYINHLMLSEVHRLRPDHSWPRDVIEAFEYVCSHVGQIERAYRDKN